MDDAILCSVFISGGNVAAVVSTAGELHRERELGHPLRILYGDKLAEVPARAIERIEEGPEAYRDALAEGARELVPDDAAPTWRGISVNAG